MSLQPNVLDPTRIDILRALQTDSERPRKQIAHDIGISEPSLSKYISDLRVRGFMRKACFVLDPQRLGLTLLCYFSLSFENIGSLDSAVKMLEQRSEVQEVHQMLDHFFELLIKVRVREGTELDRFNRELMDLPGRTGRVEGRIVGRTSKETTDLPI